MKSDLDRVRPQSENLPNLTRAEIGAVAQRQEIPGALVEAVHGCRDRQAADGVALEILRRGLVREFGTTDLWAAKASIVDAAASDAEKPWHGLSARLVIARAVTKRPLEYLAGHILGVGPVADPVGDIGIDPPDQGTWVREGISLPHLGPLTLGAPQNNVEQLTACSLSSPRSVGALTEGRG